MFDLEVNIIPTYYLAPLGDMLSVNLLMADSSAVIVRVWHLKVKVLWYAAH